MLLKSFAGLVAMLAAAAPASFGATAFSNYVGGDSGGSAFGFGQALAVQFTPSTDLYLTDVQMYVMSGGEGFASTLSAFLLSDDSGSPSAVLESLGSLPTQTSFTPNLEQVFASGTTLLHAGTAYWLAATLNAGSAVAGGWAGGGSPSVPTAFANTGGLAGPWIVATNGFQFIVNGSETATQTPEPASALMVGGGLVLLLAKKRFRSPRA